MTRIICVGNSLIAEDACGPRVHALLSRQNLPRDIELIDGGLAGLGLLGLVESARRVVFVDRVAGFARPNQVVTLSREEAAAWAAPYGDHNAGLSYLLRVLPLVAEGPLPEVALVGIEGEGDQRALEQAANLALQLAAQPEPLWRC